MAAKLNDLRSLTLMANTIRQDIIAMLLEAGSGHSAGPLGMADIFTALYFHEMNHDSKQPHMDNRDRFILSNGHICPVWYATLARAGYFPVDELKTLRKIGTRLHGHPHNIAAPGIENSAGPLGQGISTACGVAMAAKLDKKSYRVYCGLGDGELNEGQVWEAFMFAAAHKLDNLVMIIDRNFIQIDGNTEDIMPLEPLGDKLRGFGLHVIDIDGNDMPTILKALEAAREIKGKPVAIIAKTVPGKGVSFMEHHYEWHGKPPNKSEAEIALKELNATRMTIEAGK